MDTIDLRAAALVMGTWDPAGDLNRDGTVDIPDPTLVGRGFGR